MRRLRPLPLFLIACLAAALPRPAAGQDADDRPETGRGVVLFGTIVDQTTGEVLPSAAVTVRPADGAAGWGGETDEQGEFRSRRLGTGTYDIRVEMLGFTPVDHRAAFTEDGTVDVRIEMVPAPVQLEPIVVTAVRQSRLETQGFFERRRLGLGHTLTRQEIEGRAASRVSDIFQWIPGVRVIPGGPGRSADVRLRGNCVPQLVLDGMPLSFPMPVDELLTVGQLEALEVYHGATGPVQYARSSCGTVMAWTRDGSTEAGHPFSWRRLIAGSVLAGLIAWMASH